MMADVKRLLSIKDVEGEFILDAKDVAKAQDKSLNAVYASRKSDCKLDKLTAFDKIKDLVDANEKEKTMLNGDKLCVLAGLRDILKHGTKYEINYKEV